MFGKWQRRLRVAFVLGILFLAGSPAWAAEKKMGPGDAALVNGKSIAVTEVDREMDGVLRKMATTGQVPEKAQVETIRKSVLEELINLELMVQDAGKKGVKADAGLVADRMKAIRSMFPDEGAYNNALKRDNLSESDLKAQIEKKILVQTLVSKEVIEKVTVSPEESKAFYDSHPEAFKQPEQVHAKHILIKMEPTATAAEKKKARKEIEDIQKKVKKGEDFSALAKQYSQCPSSAQGGDLGLLQRGQTVKPFEDAAFSMKPGDTSGIVETEFGLHLLQVTEKRPEKQVPFEEAQESLQAHLKEAKVKAEFGKYLEDLKAKAKVQLSQN
jgi:peptidyl-prolyl cis-trans isomerase C